MNTGLLLKKDTEINIIHFYAFYTQDIFSASVKVAFVLFVCLSVEVHLSYKYSYCRISIVTVLSVRPSDYLSFLWNYIRSYDCRSVCQLTCLSVCLFVCLSFCPSMRASISLFTCL